MKKIIVTIPLRMWERFKHEREGYGVKTVREVVEAKLRFWEGKWTDKEPRP